MIETGAFLGLFATRSAAPGCLLGLAITAPLFVTALPVHASDSTEIYLGAKSCDAKNGFSAIGFISSAEMATGGCHDFQVIADDGSWVRLQLLGTDLVLKTKACQDQTGYDVVGVGPRSTGAGAACDLWQLVPEGGANLHAFLQSKQSHQFLEVATSSRGVPVARLSPWGEGEDMEKVCWLWRPRDMGNGVVQLALKPTRGHCKSRMSPDMDPGKETNTYGEYWKTNYSEAAPLEQAKKDAGGEEFKYQGKIYGWYNVGWKGPGFYVVYSGETEYGGGKGWNGWVHHAPHPVVVDGIPH